MSPTSMSSASVSNLAIPPANRLSTLPEGLPELTLGYGVAEWMQTWLVQPNGPRAGQPFRLTFNQFRFLLWWYALERDTSWVYQHGVRRLAKGPIGHQVPVMTPGGWVKHGDLQVGDEVFAVDGSITSVVDLGTEVTEDCYRLTFRDGASVVCTGSHRWPIEEFKGHGRTSRIATVKEMLDKGVVFNRALTKGKTKATRGGVARWRTLPSPPVEGTEADFPLPPYLLGYWLGDGDSDCPRITVGDEDLDALLSQLERLGVEHGEPTNTGRTSYRVRFGRGWASRHLREAGLLLNKHIPRQLLRSSLEQRWELLRGIVDSDGHITKTGTVEVCVMAGQLADDIFELAVSLGLMPTITHNKATLNGRTVGVRARIKFRPLPHETVSLLPRKAIRCQQERIHHRPFSRSRTIVNIEPVDPTPARCITVAHPSHQYLVGEMNIPTCNSGKSPAAAVMALAEFLGPVRLDRFDDRVPGGCRGKPVDLPLVQIAATSESQTKNTMRMVRAFAPKGSKVVKHYQIDVGKVQYFKLPEGTLEVITSSPTTAEGAEASFIVGDETEHWLPNNGGPELQSTLEDNLTKTGARMLETSNAWVTGKDSVAENTYKAWLLQEEGLLPPEAKRTLYDAVIAPPDTDTSNYESLERSLQWVYGDCDWKKKPDGTVDVAPIIARIWDPKATPEDNQRKYLNWPSAHDRAWTTQDAWNKLANPDRVVEDGEAVVWFFDGSKSGDTTALVGCCVSDGHIFVVDVWEPNPNDPDDLVPVHEVDEIVKGGPNRWDIQAFFGDVKEWESFTKVSWPKHFEELPKKQQLLIPAEDKRKNHELIAWDMRSHTMDFTRSAELTLEEIDAGGFTHDGDPRLTRHVLNMHRRPNRWGVSVGKASRDSPDKIDAGVCMIGARMVRYALLNSGKKRRRTTSGKVVVMR